MSQDDKKRMILECDATGKGELSVEKVNQSARMLGSGFLHDMIGAKKTKGRIYDAANMTIDEDEDSAWEAPAMVSEDLTEEDLLESLLQDGDEDALLNLQSWTQLEKTQNWQPPSMLTLMPESG